LKKIIFLFVLISFLDARVNSQWVKNGLAVFDSSSNLSYSLPYIASDASGTGAFICWWAVKDLGYVNVYAQRIDSSGKIYWQKNGIPLCNASGGRSWPQIISDGEGGAIAAWEDYRPTNNDTYIYAQKVSESGKLLWGDTAVRLSNKYAGLFVKVVSDGEGGAYFTWIYYSSSNEHAVVVQRINNSGQREWGEDGIVVTITTKIIFSNDAEICTDGNGGCIISWAESGDVYSQKLDKDGNKQWTDKGKLVSTNNTTFIMEVNPISDKKGGLYLEWSKSSTGELFCQHISKEGALLWDYKTTRIDTMPFTGAGGARRLLLDNNGGLFFGNGRLIQRLDSNGNRLWEPHGVWFIDSASGCTNSVMIPDMEGGVINITECYDPVIMNSGWQQIMAQRIDKDGNIRWKRNGIQLTDNPVPHIFPKAVSDGSGGGIVAWSGQAKGCSVNALRITNSGILTKVDKPVDAFITGESSLMQNYPNPFNPETIISYHLPQKGKVEVIIYDVQGKEVTTLENTIKEGGDYRVTWNGRTNTGAKASSGMYFYQIIFEKKSLTKKMLLIR
jgi:hypothetical protein